jgi:hypothetical protein
MSREDSEVVCMLGSGGMARSFIDAFVLVRPRSSMRAEKRS